MTEVNILQHNMPSTSTWNLKTVFISNVMDHSNQVPDNGSRNHYDAYNPDCSSDVDYESDDNDSYHEQEVESSATNNESGNKESIVKLNATTSTFCGKWSLDEDNRLRDIVMANNAKNWKRISSLLGNTRTDVQCLHRWNKVLKPGLHKGAWSKDEDAVVKSIVLKYGVGKVKWSEIACKLPGRIGKQCRERWFNHLDPAITKKEWSIQEDILLLEAQQRFGNKWCDIAKLLPGRTENAVKNRWNSSAMRKWVKERSFAKDVKHTIDRTSPSLVSVPYDTNQYPQARSNSFDYNSTLSINLSQSSIASMNPVVAQSLSCQKFIVPDDLRPARIDTNRISRSHQQQDALSSQLLSLLRDLKDTPKGLPSASAASHDTQSNHFLQHAVKSSNPVENDPARTKIVAFSSALNSTIASDDEVSVDDLTSRDSSRSPTSVALERFRQELCSQPIASISERNVKTKAVVEPNILSLQLLPHFKYLNESIQRDIVSQLLSKFQSTSFTPRNFCFVNTPVGIKRVLETNDLSSNSVDFSGLGSLQDTSGYIDPNCFEMDDDSNGKALGDALGEGDSISDRPCLASDELAIGAAISVAMQIINGNVSPELLSFLVEPGQPPAKRKRGK